MRFATVLAAGAMLAMTACTTSRPEMRVTRFHLGQPIAPGQVAVEPLNPAMGQSLEYGVFAGAVSRELGRLGFTLAPGVAGSELVAVTTVSRSYRAKPGNGSGLSIGLGGGTFSGGRRGGGVGLGGGVTIPVGGTGRGGEYAFTELSVQLKRRSDGTVIWEGRAETAAKSDTAAASPDATAQALASALFAGFPGESGRTVVVK